MEQKYKTQEIYMNTSTLVMTKVHSYKLSLILETFAPSVKKITLKPNCSPLVESSVLGRGSVWDIEIEIIPDDNVLIRGTEFLRKVKEL